MTSCEMLTAQSRRVKCTGRYSRNAHLLEACGHGLQMRPLKVFAPFSLFLFAWVQYLAKDWRLCQDGFQNGKRRRQRIVYARD